MLIQADLGNQWLEYGLALLKRACATADEGMNDEADPLQQLNAC
jgi:hypothetical protein